MSVPVNRLNFGVVPVGQGQARNLWVSFPAIAGGCGVLQVVDVTFSDAASFELAAPETLPLSIPYGESAALAVRFRPHSVGSTTGTMEIFGSDGAGQATVNLIGMGLGRASLPLILLNH